MTLTLTFPVSFVVLVQNLRKLIQFLGLDIKQDLGIITEKLQYVVEREKNV